MLHLLLSASLGFFGLLGLALFLPAVCLGLPLLGFLLLG